MENRESPPLNLTIVLIDMLISDQHDSIPPIVVSSRKLGKFDYSNLATLVGRFIGV